MQSNNSVSILKPRTWKTGGAVAALALLVCLGAVHSAFAASGIVKVSPTSGPVGAMVSVSVSKFPANTSVKITFNGKQVTTIMTDNMGAGAGMFIVPEVPPFQYEVRGFGAGGKGQTVFGYAWFRVTKKRMQDAGWQR